MLATEVAGGKPYLGAERLYLALCLCLYYIGSSVAGSAGRVAWADGGWFAVALLAITLLVIALAGVTVPR